MKNKLPDTSIDANRRATLEMRSTHWSKILLILSNSNQPLSMEKIAERLKWDVNRVSRRTKEMEGLQLICKNGKGVTKSGRACYLYSLTQHGKKKQEADAIANQPKEEIKPQATLF